MVEIARSLAAEGDLIAILEYGTGRWGRVDALAFVLSFEEAYDVLSGHPLIGRTRPELGVGIRSWLYRDYILYYRCDGRRVEIMRILHGAADAGPVDTWQ